MFRKACLFAALSLPLIFNNPLRPGMVNNPKGPAFDCYRSFHKQLEMTGIFAKDLGITTRCVFAARLKARMYGPRSTPDGWLRF